MLFLFELRIMKKFIDLFVIYMQKVDLLYINKFTIATANRERRRMTIALRAMRIHLVTLTMVVRDESARSI